MKKMMQLFVVSAVALIICMGSSGCGSDGFESDRVELKNESSYTVTISPSSGQTWSAFVLAPGEKGKIYETRAFFTYRPSDKVRFEEHDGWGVFHNR